MPPDNKDFADRLRQAMLRSGLSGAELARRARVSRSYIHEICHGQTKRISAEVLARLAGALGVSPHWLRTGEDDTDPRDAEIARLRAENARLREILARVRLVMRRADDAT